MPHWDIVGLRAQVTNLLVEVDVGLQHIKDPGLLPPSRNAWSGVTPQFFSVVTIRSCASAFRAVTVAMREIFR